MADISKLRMNLASISKVDPYAKDIVDSSSHVAFYTFNEEKNEWEKTDVEGSFFIYSRNAEPYHSIFINNRLNTNTFVEPITAQLEVQCQAPFLLYRNERSRIRGFWFYNDLECSRIGSLVSTLAPKDPQAVTPEHTNTPCQKQKTVNIFKMLSKAQQEYNNSLTQTAAPSNVLKFFEAAKPTEPKAIPKHEARTVEELETQQVSDMPRETIHQPSVQVNNTCHDLSTNSGVYSFMKPFSEVENESTQIAKLLNPRYLKTKASTRTAPDDQRCLRELFCNERSSQLDRTLTGEVPSKPTLLSPAMFENATDTQGNAVIGTAPLNKAQLVQAMSFLIHNDDDFVQKLHEAYLQSYVKSAYKHK